MSETRIIDGKAFAEKLRANIAQHISKLKQEKNITPGLAVVLVGNDPASEVYVRNKAKFAKEVGMNSYEFRLPADIGEAELLAKVQSLNINPDVHGILVQLPLPKQINENAVISAIDPKKDVDGFHVINAGKLATGQDGFVPCTPLGCLMLLRDTLGDMSGLHAVIIGRSNIVGKPMAQLLLKENCTVTIAHSKTRDLPALVKAADIVVAAVGKPEIVKGSWIKKGAVVIDVGINRLPPPIPPASGGGVRGGKLVGDVAFQECLGLAAAITPVPGGVGPMTIACLLENTLKAAQLE